MTPHKAQKALVVRKLMELFPEADPDVVYGAVDTVERFQGGERNLIIVSYGVGDTDIIEGEEGFLLQLERTNVAISRAKAKCIVIMPKTLAYHLPSDQKAADTSVALKSGRYFAEPVRFAVNDQTVYIEHTWHAVPAHSDPAWGWEKGVPTSMDTCSVFVIEGGLIVEFSDYG